MPPAPAEAQIAHKDSAPGAGPLIGTVIIVMVLMLGAVFFVVQKIQNREYVNPPAYIPGDQV